MLLVLLRLPLAAPPSPLLEALRPISLGVGVIIDRVFFFTFCCGADRSSLLSTHPLAGVCTVVAPALRVWARTQPSVQSRVGRETCALHSELSSKADVRTFKQQGAHPASSRGGASQDCKASCLYL